LDFSNRYILGFALLLCLASALGVSSLAVSLKDLQDANKLLDKRTNILQVAGVLEPGQKVTIEEADALFKEIDVLVIDRQTGATLDVDPETVDPLKMQRDPDHSEPTPEEHKKTQVSRLPDQLVLYRVNSAGHEGYVLPIWGVGLWSTLLGFLALDDELETITGITYYEHGETAGLGGEVDNPNWKAQWPGKRAFDESGEPAIEVVKAGLLTPGKEDVQVDGLSGATITTKGVEYMVQMWLSEDGYGKYFDTVR
jgi:Na+-transporting NADH:ubiquinone oxidoreductase subunit C